MTVHCIAPFLLRILKGGKLLVALSKNGERETEREVKILKRDGSSMEKEMAPKSLNTFNFQDDYSRVLGQRF